MYTGNRLRARGTGLAAQEGGQQGVLVQSFLSNPYSEAGQAKKPATWSPQCSGHVSE